MFVAIKCLQVHKDQGVEGMGATPLSYCDPMFRAPQGVLWGRGHLMSGVVEPTVHVQGFYKNGFKNIEHVSYFVVL